MPRLLQPDSLPACVACSEDCPSVSLSAASARSARPASAGSKNGHHYAGRLIGSGGRERMLPLGAPGSLVGRVVRCDRGARMDEPSVTVADLVARFALRRRAPSETFHAGVRLARAGKARVTRVTNVEVAAIVSDPDPLGVILYADDNDDLSGRCDCGASGVSVCSHQVAAAHALWAERDSRAVHGGHDSMPHQPEARSWE